jgi:hypothetical protein
VCVCVCVCVCVRVCAHTYAVGAALFVIYTTIKATPTSITPRRYSY